MCIAKVYEEPHEELKGTCNRNPHNIHIHHIDCHISHTKVSDCSNYIREHWDFHVLLSIQELHITTTVLVEESARDAGYDINGSTPSYFRVLSHSYEDLL